MPYIETMQPVNRTSCNFDYEFSDEKLCSFVMKTFKLKIDRFRSHKSSDGFNLKQMTIKARFHSIFYQILHQCIFHGISVNNFPSKFFAWFDNWNTYVHSTEYIWFLFLPYVSSNRLTTSHTAVVSMQHIAHDDADDVIVNKTIEKENICWRWQFSFISVELFHMRFSCLDYAANGSLRSIWHK